MMDTKLIQEAIFCLFLTHHFTLVPKGSWVMVEKEGSEFVVIFAVQLSELISL